MDHRSASTAPSSPEQPPGAASSASPCTEPAGASTIASPPQLTDGSAVLPRVGTATPSDDTVPPPASGRRPRVHRGWWVAFVAFIALVGAAGFRATPSVFIDPLHAEFGWSRGTISSAVSLNVLLYGLTSPFASALMDRYGIRRVVSCALLLVSLGSGLTVFMAYSWQLILLWGLLVGIGTGSMALAFAATVTSRWFVARRGLVSGVLTAGGAAGQLVFLPVVALLVEGPGWRMAALAVSAASLLVVPLVVWVLRDRPEDVGLLPYGAPDGYRAPPRPTGGAATGALRALVDAARTRPFWLLAGTFAICGASTNGLIATHFVPAAHDHGMPVTAGASLLALIGVFDLVGTIGSGWLTDRVDPRLLLAVYYALRGVSLFFLPLLLAETVEPPMLFFIVFYGLDWVATVPPTMALCRAHYGERGPVVFGWVLAAHQVGAGATAWAAGVVRDVTGAYDQVWTVSGALCALAALMAVLVRTAPRERGVGATTGKGEPAAAKATEATARTGTGQPEDGRPGAS